MATVIGEVTTIPPPDTDKKLDKLFMFIWTRVAFFSLFEFEIRNCDHCSAHPRNPECQGNHYTPNKFLDWDDWQIVFENVGPRILRRLFSLMVSTVHRVKKIEKKF